MIKRNRIEILYLFIVLLTMMLLICATFFKEQIYESKQENPAVKLTDMEYTRVNAADAPCGVRETYTFNLPEKLIGENSILVYTRHQNVRMFCNGTLVYSMKADPSNWFGKTPGCQWNQYALNNEESSATVVIELDPVYKSAIGKEPMVLFGSEYNCLKYLFRIDGVEWILSIITIICGVTMMLEFLFCYCTKKLVQNGWLMGFVALTVGCWKWGDLRLTAFLIRNSIALSMLPILSIMLLGIPWVLFGRKIFHSRDNRIWNIPVVLSLICLIVTELLQVFQIADIKESLFANHVVLALSIGLLLFFSIAELIRYKANKKMKFAMLTVFLCMLGGMIDLHNFYVNQDSANMRIGMLCFLMYLITMMVYSVMDIKQLIKSGEEAGHFKEMAYKDALTGVKSRVCFRDDLARMEARKQKVTFVTCDLNNLKKVNDTLGHEVGDQYIKAGAQLIEETFREIGKCYRIGGDEFWVIIDAVSENECKVRMNRVETALPSEIKKLIPNVELGVACGYATYDEAIDRDYNETMRRADKAMYIRKIQIKNQ